MQNCDHTLRTLNLKILAFGGLWKHQTCQSSKCWSLTEDGGITYHATRTLLVLLCLSCFGSQESIRYSFKHRLLLTCRINRQQKNSPQCSIVQRSMSKTNTVAGMFEQEIGHARLVSLRCTMRQMPREISVTRAF